MNEISKSSSHNSIDPGILLAYQKDLKDLTLKVESLKRQIYATMKHEAQARLALEQRPLVEIMSETLKEFAESPEEMYDLQPIREDFDALKTPPAFKIAQIWTLVVEKELKDLHKQVMDTFPKLEKCMNQKFIDLAEFEYQRRLENAKSILEECQRNKYPLSQNNRQLIAKLINDIHASCMAVQKAEKVRKVSKN